MRLFQAPQGRAAVVLDYALIVVGSLLVAAGTDLFFVPNKVVSGGVTGIAIIAHYLAGTPVGLVVARPQRAAALAGVALRRRDALLPAHRRLGGRACRSAIDLLAPLLHPPTSDRLLVICYGGLLDGLGMGLVFRGRGTTGGTDVLARLAHRFLGVGIGQALLAMNVVIFAVAGVHLRRRGGDGGAGARRSCRRGCSTWCRRDFRRPAPR